ncbi:AraC family transcriptional regulator [Andreprevotia lacus DSM 23236]|uniref:AraC family transcriptional regulator n=1 Tax=Andreprevotia lacus DSM 23236 TaxID=1121001 RepID=A0A1W1XV96_9NEIS|nr:AraC family transcriptional regulator [Andreprevotia lacus]SMC27900.1 AraC family transcriptional regulator [Andreprevotia lacus DSM 23236]
MSDPNSPLARQEYARRFNRVLDHIDQHLAEPIDLAQLADVAHFSRFHFHRLFAAWMGETLGDYLRRRRLERGTFLLSCQPELNVLSVALACGFGSGEAFARAFKLHFGSTPTAWRAAAAVRREAAKRNPDQAARNDDQAPQWPPAHHGCADQHTAEPSDMQVQLSNLKPVRVAYQRHIGPYGPAITAFWQQRVTPWLQSHGLERQTCYGIGHDAPDVTPAAKCRYDACVALPDGVTPSGNITTLPGGRYAVAEFAGPLSEIPAAWTWLLRDWLPGSGLQCDDRPCFEQFEPHAAFDAASGVFRCQLCIPVRPL